jgi:ribose 1,5-bisphosphate isomerase
MLVKGDKQKFKDVVRAIKELRIQGAAGVAREGVHALFFVLKSSKTVTKEALVAELYHARDQLITARPTEPFLRNALTSVLHDLHVYDDEHNLVVGVGERIESVMRFIDHSQKKIASLVAAKIRHHSVVFTHCHSSSVVDGMLLAKKQKKEFLVYNTETRPMWQGRRTATELAAAGIHVIHFVDSGAAVAMKDVHIAFFGADALTSDFVYNKIGSGMFAELLETRQIPLFICTNSWKFDDSVKKGHHEIIEERDIVEVWKDVPKHVEVENPAFEEISFNRVAGIISELGVLSPKAFVKRAKKEHKWMS